MAIENFVYKRLINAISPVVSVGVGSAICTVCMKKGLNPAMLEDKDLSVLKPALIEHYKMFWSHKLELIVEKINSI